MSSKEEWEEAYEATIRDAEESGLYSYIFGADRGAFAETCKALKGHDATIFFCCGHLL